MKSNRQSRRPLEELEPRELRAQCADPVFTALCEYCHHELPIGAGRYHGSESSSLPEALGRDQIEDADERGYYLWDSPNDVEECCTCR